jgi:hypothetical protein
VNQSRPATTFTLSTTRTHREVIEVIIADREIREALLSVSAEQAALGPVTDSYSPWRTLCRGERSLSLDPSRRMLSASRARRPRPWQTTSPRGSSDASPRITATQPQITPCPRIRRWRERLPRATVIKTEDCVMMGVGESAENNEGVAHYTTILVVVSLSQDQE